MATTIVKDSAGLVSALKVAKAGDVIQLQAGTYAPTAITGAKFDGAVTITSQDPTAMAKLTGLMVKDSQGLTFRGLEFVVDAAKPDYQFQILGSKNVNLDALNVHGSLDGNPLNDAAALMIRNSANVTVTNSEFHELRHGIQHLDSSGVRINNNHFHDIRTDGIRGGGSSNVTIKGNYFTDFHAGEGDHPDAIQFWTTHTTKSATNILVQDNVVLRGGGDPIQGIFFRDQVGGLPFTDVKIVDNLIVGGMYHGITLNSGKNLVLTGNVVSGLPDQKSWISVINSDGVSMVANKATEYHTDGATNIVREGDATIATPSDGGKALQAAWYSANKATAEQLSDQVMRFVQEITLVNAGTISLAALDAKAAEAVREMEVARANAVAVTGTAGADKLAVDGARDTFVDGGGGNDIIYGGSYGHNTLSGGSGDDTYYVKNMFETVVEKAGEGADTVITSVDFGLGANIENLRMANGAYFGAGNELNNRISGSDAANELHGLGGNDLIQAGGGNDLVSGGNGADTLAGGMGDDTLQGDAEADRLGGDAGSDSLSAGLGADTLEGGAGADTLSGGAGSDVFLFRAADLGATDRILDFSRSEGDKINLSPIDANTSLAGDQRFTFVGSNAFTKTAGELRAVVSNGNTTLMGDTNGDGLADFQLVMVGNGTMQAADFIL
ncbi:right-handed parallel beta-helix repeat-containing protein [Phenylobacterium sp.]|uniref:right-handed parallel beta-helix repeat-containing protein n=1 Tax=Phenylobacterium sp. TaxID=1871053 RepID=UPI0037CCB34A